MMADDSDIYKDYPSWDSQYFDVPINMANLTDDTQRLLMLTKANLTSDLQLHEYPGYRIFLVTIYAIVILIGFLGNFIVVIVIIRNKHLHTVTNIFIANLAISDIFLCIFNLPFGLTYQLMGDWIFGEILCYIIPSTFAVPMYISTMLILMIAIDRYILIVFPFKKKMTKMMALVIVILLTVITLVLAIPLAMYTQFDVVDIPAVKFHRTVCYEHWPTQQKRLIFTFACFALQFCLPLVLSTVMYTHIFIVLKRRPLAKNDNRRNQKTNKILMAIILVFVICWLPFNLLNIILDVHPGSVSGMYIAFVDLCFRLFAVSSACINPFMYGWLNDNFRKEFAVMVCNAAKGVTSYTSRQNGHSCADQSMQVYTQVQSGRSAPERPTKSAFV